MSIRAKGVSRGVHNIAFLLSPDHFHAFDLVFFSFFFFGHLFIMKGCQKLYPGIQGRHWPVLFDEVQWETGQVVGS